MVLSCLLHVHWVKASPQRRSRGFKGGVDVFVFVFFFGRAVASRSFTLWFVCGMDVILVRMGDATHFFRCRCSAQQCLLFCSLRIRGALKLLASKAGPQVLQQRGRTLGQRQELCRTRGIKTEPRGVDSS